VEEHENAEDMVQAWRTDNMPGEEFPPASSCYIKVSLPALKDGYEPRSEKPALDLGFLEPDLETEYDSEEV